MACTFCVAELPRVLRGWGAFDVSTFDLPSRHPSARWLCTRRSSEFIFSTGAKEHWKNKVFRDFFTFSDTLFHLSTSQKSDFCCIFFRIPKALAGQVFPQADWVWMVGGIWLTQSEQDAFPTQHVPGSAPRSARVRWSQLQTGFNNKKKGNLQKKRNGHMQTPTDVFVEQMQKVRVASQVACKEV